MTPEQLITAALIVVFGALVTLLVKALRNEAMQRFNTLDRDIALLRDDCKSDNADLKDQILKVRDRLHDLEGAPTKKQVIAMLEEMDIDFGRRTQVQAASAILVAAETAEKRLKQAALEAAELIRQKTEELPNVGKRP